MFKQPKQANFGCVAKTGGSLGRVAFVLTELGDRYPLHEHAVAAAVFRQKLAEEGFQCEILVVETGSKYLAAIQP